MKLKSVLSLILVLGFTLLPSGLTFGNLKLERKLILFDSSLNPEDQNVLVRKFGGQTVKQLRIVNGAVVLMSSSASAALKNSGEAIACVEDDGYVFASQVQSACTSKQVLPWGVARIDANSAWSLTTARGVKIAVMDSGIDLTHPDLALNIKGGFNAINPKSAPNDDYGHGTSVAGVIAASNNSFGVVGVGPEADLYAVKVLGSGGFGRISDVIEGIQWSVDNQMHVANISFGTPTYSRALHVAIKKAYASGLIMVAAAGNRGPDATTTTVDYPARFDEVIAVSASTSKDSIAPWSSCGPEVDLAAPGENIPTTGRSETYVSVTGTSIAAPHVTGAIVLKLQVSPALKIPEVIGLLKSTADPINNASVGAHDCGIVNALALVKKS